MSRVKSRHFSDLVDSPNFFSSLALELGNCRMEARRHLESLPPEFMGQQRVQRNIARLRAASGRLLTVGLAVLIITGCASRPTVPGSGIDWPHRAELLLQLPRWEANGRVAVKSGSEGGQGSLRWVQEGADTRINLHGPFGAGALQIDWSEKDLVVTGKSGDVTQAYSGSDAIEQFLTDQFGWSFPARSLRYWILGVADPDLPGRSEFDADGWLMTLEQSGWAVSYDRFAKVRDHWMPRKIIIQNERARIKLVVDKWRW